MKGVIYKKNPIRDLKICSGIGGGGEAVNGGDIRGEAVNGGRYWGGGRLYYGIYCC